MSTPMSTFLRTLAGSPTGTHQHSDVLFLQTATTVTTGTPAAITTHNFHRETQTAAQLLLTPYADWQHLSFRVVAGPGVFGRAVTVHFAIGHDGEAAPTTIAQMVRLGTYTSHTYGGAADPVSADKVYKVKFVEGTSDVLKARSWFIGGRAQLFYFFTEADFGTNQIAGDRVQIHITGEYSTFGRNY